MSTYVYGFAPAARPLDVVDGATGVGEPSPPVRVVRSDALAAVVSDAPDDLRPKRRDLEAHESVLERLCEGGTVLPLRFGTVAPDDAAVLDEMTNRSSVYSALLARLDGKVEINVKGLHRQDDVLRDLLLTDRPLRDWNDRLRESGGGSPEARMEFGEEVAAALEARRAEHAAALVAELRPHASEVSVGGPTVESCFVNVSFLVADDARPAFDAAVERLRTALGALAEVNAYGPLPPYSFVTDD